MSELSVAHDPEAVEKSDHFFLTEQVAPIWWTKDELKAALIQARPQVFQPRDPDQNSR